MRVITTIIFLACWPALASSFITFNGGKCPKVTTMPDFDLDQYLGLWFSLKNFEVPYQFGTSCVTALYSRNYRTGGIYVVNGGRRRIFFRDEKVRAVGEANIVDPKYPGALRVQFGQAPDIFGNGDAPNYLILDTDYKSYSLVYSCQQLGELPFKIESCWVLTREPGKEPAKINALMDLLRSYKIDPKYFKPITQDGCYGPN